MSSTMIEHGPNNVVSAEARENVTHRLQSLGGPWIGSPDYATFSRQDLHQRLEDVYKTVHEETNAEPNGLRAAYEQSIQLVHTTFDQYESNGTDILGYRAKRAFVVPMRSDRANEDYASESRPFMPLLDPEKFGVSSEIRMRSMYGLPPMVLDTYSAGEEPDQRGALILAPMYADMIEDIFNSERAHQITDIATFILKETTEFAHKRIGADVIGLGAILPGLTNFGADLRKIEGMERLVTTTGHGGTVYTIVETAKKVIRETSTETHGSIGIIGGAGSIGYSTIASVLHMMPELTIEAFDTRGDRLKARAADLPHNERISFAGSASEILRNNNLIISAITGRIDLDEEDPEHQLDLTGKVIIDDSQPGCFDRDQVEARGGHVIWVVGTDETDTRFITRDNGYNYGDKSGLYGVGSEFACGQEAAVIAASGEFDVAIRGPVKPEDVLAIGGLFQRFGVGVAPFQAFGQPVHID